jgi:hypothetical protein
MQRTVRILRANSQTNGMMEESARIILMMLVTTFNQGI